MASNSGVTLADIRSGKSSLVFDNSTKSDTITLIQRTLFRAGYWSGPADGIDGIYGNYSVAATRGFQFMNGDENPTGVMDKTTLAKLEAWSGTLSTTRNTTPSAEYIRKATQYAILGDSGAAITLIRSLLNKKGYSCAATGSYDATLQTVVKQFQTDNGLSADGNVGQATLAVLENTISDTGWCSNGKVTLTAGLLARCGFSQIMLCSDFIDKLNNALNKFGFTEKNQVRQILAQSMIETIYGRFLMETGYQAGVTSYTDGASYAPYYGAGFIHLTGETGYDLFGSYLTTEHITPALTEKKAYKTVQVAIAYPGESMGWFLRENAATVLTNIKNGNGTDNDLCEALTKIVNGAKASSTTIKNRQTQLAKIKTILK